MFWRSDIYDTKKNAGFYKELAFQLILRAKM